jgi:hypothetical protein
MLFHTSWSDTEHGCHLVVGPAFDIPQHKHLLLPGRKFAKRLPDHFTLFAADRSFFRGYAPTWQLPIDKFGRGIRAPPPPPRTLPITASVHGDLRKPRIPGMPLLRRSSLHQFEEDLLCNFFGLLLISQQQAAQAQNSRMMLTVKFFVTFLIVWHDRFVSPINLALRY